MTQKTIQISLDDEIDEIDQRSSLNHQLSINLNKHLMLQPQKLDNNALDQILNDQVKAHLLLDDKEQLQVKSPAEFVALFKSLNSSSSNVSVGVGVGANHNTSSSSSSSSTSTNSSGSSSQSSSLNSSNTSTPLSLSPHPNDDKLVKCVSIFGNTGDGKSHTLNQTFFNGRPIFRTSDKQETCTLGVWCAYDPLTHSLIFDTEGLLGSTHNENERMRLLLKVLAVSDVIIYRTRAERLHNDLFKFLSDASVAYLKYFSKELKQAALKLKLDAISLLGPCCVIFHETNHTETLCDDYDASGQQQRTISHQIADRFAKLDLSYNAFSLIEYVGTRTNNNGGGSAMMNVDSKTYCQTDFTKLALRVRELLRNNSVRQPRKLSSIFHVLKVLNDKFNGTINKNQISTFADEYFTCSSICLSCGKRCQNSINHIKDGILHENTEKCHYDHQYDNKVYVCKQCHEAGKETVVIPKTAATNDNSFVGIVKYTYSGYVLECPHHGVIYRSRQYWYGNPEPESVVRTELRHIWSGQQNNVGTSHNLSRKIIDNVSYLGESLQSVSAKPTMIAKQWIADQVNPTYWVPNVDIIDCFSCHKPFINTLEKKHHCRGCGKGFCDKCSSKRRIIEWWSPTDKVRVCNSCYDKARIEEPKQLNPNYISTSNSTNSLSSLGISGNNEIIARKVTETVSDTIGLITYATKIPFDVLKESARPSYWKPDNECVKCALCKKEFDELLLLHHCRSCGNGVCNGCSPSLRPVPSRGWETPVRVCNNCIANEVAN